MAFVTIPKALRAGFRMGCLERLAAGWPCICRTVPT